MANIPWQVCSCNAKESMAQWNKLTYLPLILQGKARFVFLCFL